MRTNLFAVKRDRASLWVTVEIEMSQPMPVHVPDDDEVNEVLAAFGGDAREAIRDLLALKTYYEREMDFAALALSYGFTRGWKPGQRPRK